MGTVVSPPKDQGPDLLLHWEREFGETRWRQAAILSLLLHLVLGGGVLVSSSGASRAPAPEPLKPRITPLVDPPTQLTQHAPNRGKLSKDITADMLLPTPRAQKGAPTHAAAAPRLSKLMIAHTHHIVAQQYLLMLDFLPQNFERISRVEHAYRSGILPHDGDILETAFLHDRPDIAQSVARTA